MIPNYDELIKKTLNEICEDLDLIYATYLWRRLTSKIIKTLVNNRKVKKDD